MTVKVFGEKGVEGIKYLGDKPFQWRGEYRLYLWKINSLPQWVDKRDIPCLIAEVGIENLAGRNLDDYKEKKEEKAKAKKSKKAATIEQEPEQESGPVIEVVEAEAETEAVELEGEPATEEKEKEE